MTLPFQQEIQSIQGEIVEVATIVARIQQRLVDVTRRSEEHGDIWQARATELEARNKEIVNHSKWLTRQNSELERKVSESQPQMDSAIDARNAAFLKLHNARKVIRDLVEERLQIENQMGRGASGEEVNEEEEAMATLREALDEGGDPSSDSGSEKTIRMNPTQQPDVTQISGMDPLQKNVHQVSPASGQAAGAAGSREGIAHHMESSAESSGLSIPVSPSRSSRSDQEVWKVHYSKPPASSDIACGPVSHNRLLRHSIVTKETIELLQSLELSPDFGLRLQIVGDLAFVYDPVFLEGPSKTYILDWGNETVNSNIEKYIRQNRAEAPVLHTFVFPVNENKWFYVGAHTWTVTDMWPVWSKLTGRKSKRKMLEKVNERSHGQVNVKTIAERLDTGELRQFCVHISSHPHRAKSEEFCKKMGYTGPVPRRSG